MKAENDLVKLWSSPILSGVLWCSSILCEELWSLLPERNSQISSHILTQPRIPITHLLKLWNKLRDFFVVVVFFFPFLLRVFLLYISVNKNCCCSNIFSLTCTILAAFTVDKVYIKLILALFYRYLINYAKILMEMYCKLCLTRQKG